MNRRQKQQRLRRLKHAELKARKFNRNVRKLLVKPAHAGIVRDLQINGKSVGGLWRLTYQPIRPLAKIQLEACALASTRHTKGR